MRLLYVLPRSFFLLLLLAAGSTLIGQDAPGVVRTVQYYGTDEGLPSRVILGSAYDQQQLLWASSERGLSRIDGHRVTFFHDLPQGFNGPLRRAADGMLYCQPASHSDSLEVFDPATLTSFGTRLGTPDRGHFAGVYHRSGQPLFFARGNAVYRYQTRSPAREVRQLGREVSLNDRLIQATDSSYLMYYPQRNELEELRHDSVFRYRLPSSRAFPTLHHDGSGGIWASNSDGLFYKSAFATSFSPQPPLTSGGVVNLINEDRHGHLILAHLPPYLKRITDLDLVAGGQRWPAPEMFEPDDRIINFAGDNFLRQYRAHTYGGLYLHYIDDKPTGPFTRYLYTPRLEPGRFGHVMRGFTADNDGNVYANKDSANPYWFRVNAGTLTLDTLYIRENDGSINTPYGCGTNLINYRGDIFGHNCDLNPIISENVDLSEYIGFVYRYRPADDSWFRWRLPVDNHVVRWIDFGRTEEELIVFTQDHSHDRGKLYYFYPTSGKFQEILPSGPEFHLSGYTKSVAKDTARNCYWIATDWSFYRFDVATEALTSFAVPDEGRTAIMDVLPLPSGRLLLGTRRHGLRVFDPATATSSHVGGLVPPGQLPPNPESFMELPTNAIASLAITPEQQLLVATFDGLIMHSEDETEGFVYTTQEGLTDDEFNTPSLFHNVHDNRWYAGGINGFVSFRAKDLTPAPSPFKPAITGLRMLNSNVGKETAITLPSKPVDPVVVPASNLFFTIDFAIPDFTGNGEKRFQTWLEGHEPTWNKSTPQASVRYTDLKPGQYKFHLRAYDSRKRKSPEEVTLDITVLKPWYLQWWFYTLLALIGLAILYNEHRRSVNRLRKDLEAQRRVQSLELRSLRQQLNPHFISNAMTAIRQYVKKEKPAKAAGYLTDFSLVMRSFLEASRNPFTPLGEEIDMLERYIGLEKLRFPDKFEYTIEVDPGISREMDVVPSLLLQPIIENAINHGLYPLSSGGELKIRFFPDPDDEDYMICTISDNGVGRVIAAQRETAKEHISRATEILQERLDIIAAEDLVRLQLTTQDLYPDREHTGTLVRMVIERG